MTKMKGGSTIVKQGRIAHLGKRKKRKLKEILFRGLEKNTVELGPLFNHLN